MPSNIAFFLKTAIGVFSALDTDINGTAEIGVF